MANTTTSDLASIACNQAGRRIVGNRGKLYIGERGAHYETGPVTFPSLTDVSFEFFHVKDSSRRASLLLRRRSLEGTRKTRGIEGKARGRRAAGANPVERKKSARLLGRFSELLSHLSVRRKIEFPQNRIFRTRPNLKIIGDCGAAGVDEEPKTRVLQRRDREREKPEE